MRVDGRGNPDPEPAWWRVELTFSVGGTVGPRRITSIVKAMPGATVTQAHLQEVTVSVIAGARTGLAACCAVKRAFRKAFGAVMSIPAASVPAPYLMTAQSIERRHDDFL